MINTRSGSDATQIGRALRDPELDLEVERLEGRVLCFADSEAEIRGLAREIRQVLQQASLWEGPVLSGQLRMWSEQEYRYVDPEHPDEGLYGNYLDPDEIRWRVRLELTGLFDSGRVLGELAGLRGRVIETGPRHIDLGATDESDAEEMARATRALDGVSSATSSELGRRQRWWIRQRRAGNYALQPPEGN